MLVVLSPRQRQILEARAGGLSFKEIALQSFLAEGTVKQYFLRARQRNRCRTTDQLIASWYKQQAAEDFLRAAFRTEQAV